MMGGRGSGLQVYADGSKNSVPGERIRRVKMFQLLTIADLVTRTIAPTYNGFVKLVFP